MPTIDDKVVAMSFENSKFESGVKQSLSTLDKLKAALNFKESGKGLLGISDAARRLNLGNIAKGVQGIEARLGALRLTAVAVFADIARRGLAAGKSLIKAFTIDPMKAGFKEYTTNLNSIQTILANTQASGATLKDVNAALDELNDYSDKTIYNFGQMARNIGTFTAAGVDLKTATASIKGIANLAALSGSNAEQASTAMYQLSQAISSGSVKLMDWNSVVNAGMGGTVFQRALAQTGEHMGQLKKGTVELVGPMKNVKIAGESFRNSLSAPGKDGWLTSKVLTTTLRMFTGDMTDAELAADGWNKKQIKAIQAQAKSAMLAATNVKTLDQVLNVAKETAGSGWAKTWRIIFGDFGEAKKTFTNLSNTINSMIIDSARARNNMLGDWKALGGRKVLIEGIKEAFHNLGAVLKPIKDAFREFFPRTTGKQLFDLTVRFKEFTEMLKPSKETITNLHRTFRGLFAVLDIGKEIIFGLFGVFKKLIGTTSAGEGGFLSFTATIGDALVAFHDWLIEGGRLSAFFDKLASVLAAPIQLLKALGTALKDAFSGISLGGVGGGIDGITKKLSPLQAIMEGIATVWNKLLDAISNSGKVMQPIIEGIAHAFAMIGPAINDTLSSMNFQAILAVVRTGLFAGLVVMFKKFLGGGSAINQITQGFGKGIMGNISGSLGALQGHLTAMQQNVKADTLKKIATAVALLAISVLALSLVDPERLGASLTAIGVMMGQLIGAMAVMEKVATSKGFLKMPVITFALLGLAIAIDTLAIAVIALSKLSWGELLKGLGGVAVLMGTMAAAAKPLSASSAGMIRAGIGMMEIAIAMRILASAVKALGEMDMTTLGKGLGSVAVGLGIMVKAMNAMPTKGMIAAGIGLVLLGTGLRILAEAVGAFGAMGMGTLAKGLVSVSIGLEFIATAMKLMPKGMILQAAGLLLVAAALNGIAKAVGTLGGMSVSELAKGLGSLAIALALLGLGLIVMQGSMGGAIALGVAAGGISLLATALKTMGEMSWMEIIKAMVALSAAFVVIGVAAAIITPVVPSLLAFGAAIFLIGGGLALTGAALFLVAAGLSALVVAAPTGFGVLLAAVTEFQKGLIENIKLFILGVLKIVQELAKTAPQFVEAIVKILGTIIDGLIKLLPKLVPLINELITTILTLLTQNQDRLIQAGYDLLLSLIQGLRDNIAQITQAVVQVIVAFINGITKNIRKIVDAGVKLVTAFLKAIASGYSGMTKAAISIITKFLGAIASNIGKVATAGLSILTKLLGAIAKGLGKVIKAGTDVIVAFINGVGNAGPRIVTAATNAIIKFINALSKNGVKLANAGLVAIVNFLNGVAKAIETHGEEVRNAGIRIGKAIVGGMVAGLGETAGDVYNKAKEIVGNVKDKLEFWKSPPDAYGKWLGQQVMLGLADGLSDTTKAVDAAAAMSQGIIATTKDIFQITSPSKVMFAIGRDVIRGFEGGLKAGTSEGIASAFSTLKEKLVSEISELNKTIKEENKKLNKLPEKEKNRTKEQKKEFDALGISLEAHYKRLGKLTAAQKALNGGLKVTNETVKKGKNELLGYAKQLEKINEQIETAKGIFEDFKAQFSELPDFTFEDENGNPVEDQLGAYGTALGKQADATEKFASTMETLKGLGIDDQTYQALLEAGPAAQQFIDQLIKGGKPAVDAINALDVRIGAAATKIGNNAAEKLYKAGEKAAEGFVTGLEKEKTKIIDIMDDIVDAMVKRLKGKLKIGSPSKVFAEIGKRSVEGMAKGFSDSSGTITDAVDTTGQEAITAMQQSMRDISNAVTDEMDVNPTITPILDLTLVKSKAAELAALTAVGSYGQASAISSTQAATEADKIAAIGGTAVKFEQNNYSPEALSNIEIYRQTRNQLSLLKSSFALT